MKSILIISVFVIISFSWSCRKGGDSENIDTPEFVYSGGETTIFDGTSNAFSTPAPNLSLFHEEKHLDGDLAFDQIFITEPAVLNGGLGPVFNNNSCVSCHIRNGRSEPSTDGNELSGFLIRLSIPGHSNEGGPKPVPFYGGQLQNRAIYSQAREASFTATEMQEVVEFLDGSTKTLTKLDYQLTEPYQPFPQEMMISPRVAPAVFGIGLLEAIAEEDILVNADENDTDNDGISGKPNMVWDIEEQTLTLGRFGWKAENPTALQQTADAYHQDMGITSSLFPEESCIDQPNCMGEDGQIDINDEILELTTFYVQTLAVPAVRNFNKEKFTQGRELFSSLQCSSCHIPKFKTNVGIIPEVSNQVIFPYTDLLLHDMGEGLADNRPTFSANGREWRTPPLWGVGLLAVVNGHTRYMHDGRARNIEEAILWHGGEAENSKKSYLQLSKSEREALVVFINSI